MSRTPLALVSVLAGAVIVLNVAPGEAHKPITSPYTYNDDVYPVLRDKCGRCHVTGGVAPMSLMTHADAVPWGESIRTELLAGHMPPGGLDGAPGRFRNVTGLSPREMNMLLTWVTGGTPLGPPEKTPPAMVYEDVWRLGPPDLSLPFPKAFTITSDAREQTEEFIIPTGVTERRWVRAVDLKPGNAAMVRAATISVRSPLESPPSTPTGVERVLGLWLPGDGPVSLDEGMAFELPPSAELLVRVLYRKTWEYERKELHDRSTVGVYLTNRPATAVQALSIAPDKSARVVSDRFSFSRPLTENALAVAIYPEAGVANTSVTVTAVRPDGSRIELIALHPRPDWRQRYWFREPISLPRGTVIGVQASVDDEMPLLSVAPTEAPRPDLGTLRFTLNTISGR